jgi:hypothetical protein
MRLEQQAAVVAKQADQETLLDIATFILLQRPAAGREFGFWPKMFVK